MLGGRQRTALAGGVAVALAGAAALFGIGTPAEAATAPDPPPDCWAEKVENGYEVNWLTPTNDGGAPIERYKIREAGFSTSVEAPATANSVVWTAPLRDPADIEFNVRALNSVGPSNPCNAPLRAGEPSPEPTPSPTPAPEPTPSPSPSPSPTPAPAGDTPCTPDSFYKDDVRDNTVDAGLTSEFRQFMASHPDQAAVPWMRINVNENWSGINYTADSDDPVWRITGGQAEPQLEVLRTQGFHMDASKVLPLNPTGDQDRLVVIYDPVFGYVAQFADAVFNEATRTVNVSSAGIYHWNTDCLDTRNPRAATDLNWSSRGRIAPAMQIRPQDLQRAIANGTGVGHVLHLFFVETDGAAGHVHPMVGQENDQFGWGAEGVRIRINPTVNLAGRGFSPGCLAIARTLQENGGYLGDNSGSSTQVKAGHPALYPDAWGISRDCMEGKITWSDFQVVTPGQQ